MRTAAPICSTHALTETGQAWVELWDAEPEIVRQVIDFCPYCRDENAREFRRRLRIALMAVAAIALMCGYDWMVGRWQWNSHRRTSFGGDLAGTLLLFDCVFGGVLILGWFGLRGMGDRLGTPEQRWGWLGHKALAVLIVAVLLGAPWLGMSM